MPFEAQHKIFKRLAEIADSKSLTKEEQEKYDNSMMVMWDNYAVYKHAEEKGIEKGIEQGKLEILISLVRDHVLSMKDAANRAEISEEEFIKLIEEKEKMK